MEPVVAFPVSRLQPAVSRLGTSQSRLWQLLAALHPAWVHCALSWINPFSHLVDQFWYVQNGTLGQNRQEIALVHIGDNGGAIYLVLRLPHPFSDRLV